MSETSVNNKRIVKNTIYLYIRMFVILFVSLYTSRVILQVVGASDYGIYNLIAGVVVLFSFINGALTSATQRYLNFYIGKHDEQNTHNVFCMSMNIYMALAIVFFVLAETIGLWFVNSQLNIPENRMNAANWVYQFTVFSFMINLIRIPYNATLIAYEKMDFYAYLSLFDVAIKLVIVYLLYISPVDKLVAYGFLYMLTDMIGNVIYHAYCKRRFAIATYQYMWKKDMFKHLLSFSSWSLLGNASSVFVQQGLNILVNVFYGVTLNAALGIANQVAGKVTQFFSNFQTAFNPQIVKYYAEGEMNEFFKLIFRSSRFSYYLMLIVSLPLMLKIDVILGIWLVDVPEYTGIFCQLILIFYLIEALTGPLWMSVQATGDIKLYQILISVVNIINIPLIYFSLKLGYPVWAVWIIRIVVDLIIYIVRCFYLNKRLKMSLSLYYKEVVQPVLLVTLLALPIPFIIERTVSGNHINFILSIVVSILCPCVMTFYFGLKRRERERLSSLIVEKSKGVIELIQHRKQR